MPICHPYPFHFHRCRWRCAVATAVAVPAAVAVSLGICNVGQNEDIGGSGDSRHHCSEQPRDCCSPGNSHAVKFFFAASFLTICNDRKPFGSALYEK
jgi:hypothetical protein